MDPTIAVNRKASFNYELLERYEAGIVLQGWEVKSARSHKAQVSDSYVIIKNGEAFWVGGVIQPLLSASTHVRADPHRSRKLLLHSSEIRKLRAAVERKGYTLVPLNLHWKNNHIKILFALGHGKKTHDKRADLKKKDWQRDQQRLARSKIAKSAS